MIGYCDLEPDVARGLVVMSGAVQTRHYNMLHPYTRGGAC